MSRDRDTVTAVTAVHEGKGPPRNSILLDKYRVETVLGFGGMGLVIQAHNLALDEKCAIKLLREDVQLDAEHVERFLREAKACVRLKSEHVAKIRDVGLLEDGRPFMVMELLEGLDLGKLLMDMGSMNPYRAIDLLLQTCDAIAEAHSIGIVHRDIKPTNLFVTRRRDDTDLLKVLDFGISKAQAGPEMSLTQTSSMLGTPAYMSPEQMRSARTVDPRSDIWALGTVLYELVEGHPPFQATNFAELCVMVATEPYTPLVNAPHLTPVIERCLAKHVDGRYQNVAELAADLGQYSADPNQAHRQIARIQRVLGIPGARDSTPLPMSRGSTPSMRPTPSPFERIPGQIPGTPSPAATPRPTMPHDSNVRSSGTWKTILALLVLFGIGIAGGLYVTGGGSPDLPATDETKPVAGSANNPSLDSGSGSATVAPQNAATIDAGAAGATTAGSADAGSGSAMTIQPPKQPVPTKKQPIPPKKQPPKKEPPKKEPPKKEPPKKEPLKKDPPRVEAAPTPKCDPFTNPRGCN